MESRILSVMAPEVLNHPTLCTASIPKSISVTNTGCIVLLRDKDTEEGTASLCTIPGQRSKLHSSV